MSDLLDESLLDHHHHHHQQQQQQHRQPISILLPPEEYAEDLELRLGRANGNIYYRKTGVEGIHDGQVMVRLKKKRFVILDYSIIPTEEEIQLASIHPHIACPEGAGKRQCVTPGCQKVGVPVLLYDSDPTEPASLYLRSGLCFTCQRNLNEKRRTQRKRKSDLLEQNGGGTGEEGSANGNGSHHHGILPLDANAQHLSHPHHHHHHAGALPHRGSNTTSGVFTIASDQKKLKLNGSVVHLAPDAIIINGPVSGARHHGEGYSFHEIGIDLSHVVQEAVHDTHRLIHAVSPTGVASTAGTTVVVTSASSSSGGVATPMAMSSDASAILSNLGDDLLTNGSEHHQSHQQQQQLLHQHHHHHTASTSSADSQNLSSEDIAAMHDKAFLALSKSLFLLSQWKAAWDAEVAAAVAQETVHDACLADAVASAAAVVAAAVTGDLPPLDAASAASGDLLMATTSSGVGGGELQHTTNSSSSTTTNMVSLLLAAEQKGDDGGMMMMKVDDDELDAVMERATNHHHNSGDDVQTFEV